MARGSQGLLGTARLMTKQTSPQMLVQMGLVKRHQRPTRLFRAIRLDRAAGTSGQLWSLSWYDKAGE